MLREQQIDPKLYYPREYLPNLLEDWPLKGDLAVPMEAIPDNLNDSMGGAWRHKQKNMKILQEQQKK